MIIPADDADFIHRLNLGEEGIAFLLIFVTAALIALASVILTRYRQILMFKTGEAEVDVPVRFLCLIAFAGYAEIGKLESGNDVLEGPY